LNIVKNNQNIAKEATQNETGQVEILTNYIVNDCEGFLRSFRCAGPRPKPKEGKVPQANKIVATNHSTAAPSLFLHAAYAIHGDLGMTQNEASGFKKQKRPRNQFFLF